MSASSKACQKLALTLHLNLERNALYSPRILKLFGATRPQYLVYVLLHAAHVWLYFGVEIARQVAEIFSGGLGWPDEDHLVHNAE